MKKASCIVIFFLCLTATILHAKKFAVIVTDPKLGSFGKYWNTDRYNYERAYFSSNGYQVFEMDATEENLIKIIIDPNVKAITYVGHGGADDNQGNTQPTLAGYTAKEWQEIIFRKLYLQYRHRKISIEEARKRVRARVKNFGKDRVVNYSCNSLINNNIADQFVDIHNPSIDRLQEILGTWEFGRNKKDRIGNVILTSKAGKYNAMIIGGYHHDNESYWKFEGRNSIVFIHRDGKITTRFGRINDYEWEGTFVPPPNWPQ